MKRVAIIGCGSIAGAHATGYQKTGTAELVAVCDIDRDKAEALAERHGGTPYTSAETMLREERPDAVSVCTPPKWHEEASCSALRAGVSVCCEKPLAHSVDSARRIRACAEETGVLCVTAYKFRFFPNVLWAQNLVDSGRLGTVVSCRNTFSGIADMTGRWFSDKAISGGGVVADNGVHSFDLLRFLFGEIHGVFAVTRKHAKSIDVEDTCRALLRMPGSVLASVDLSWSAPQSMNILEIQGTGGLVELWWSGGRFTPASGKPEEFQWPDDPVAADPFAAQLSWFLRCIDGEVQPRATVDDGVRALEVVAAAYRSATGPAWTDISGD